LKTTWLVSIPKSFHITLKFLGEVSDVQNISTALKKLVWQPISAKASHFGVFPSEKYVRVAWLGITPEEEVIALSNQVNKLLLQQR